MSTVNIVNSFIYPYVDVPYTIMGGTWTQTTLFGNATATAIGGAGGSSTPYTLQRQQALIQIPATGAVPFFDVSAQTTLRTANPTRYESGGSIFNIGGSGSMSASLSLEIPDILQCSYSGTMSTTYLNKYPDAASVTTATGVFSLSFMGITVSRSDVPIGGYEGWFPGVVIGYVPLKISVGYGYIYSPSTVIVVATLIYPVSMTGNFDGTGMSTLVLGAAEGITGSETTTPGGKTFSISASHYQAANNWTMIPDGSGYLEISDTRTYVATPAPPPAESFMVRGVSVVVCGDTDC